MFGINVGTVGKIANALIEGDRNIIEDLVVDKLEDFGRELIARQIHHSPLGEGAEIAQRIAEAHETAGASELERLTKHWLRPRPPRLPGVLGKFHRAFERAYNDTTRFRKKARWQRGGWAQSRDQWLNDGWRHDWRSQPRNRIGEWIPGRLSYAVSQGSRVSRRVMRIRKLRRARRAVGRQAVRGIVSSWAS